jgi:hypothetical protein
MKRQKKSLFGVLLIVLLAVSLLSGCGKKEKAPEAPSEDKAYTPLISEEERDQFRASLDFGAKQYEDVQGVPLYVGANEIENSRSLSGNVLTVSFNISASPDEFSTFYERELPNFGWDIVERKIEDERIRYEAIKSGRRATISANIEEAKITEFKIITD